MNLNQKLTVTGIYREGQPAELFPEYDAHLNRMQQQAFEVGKVLMNHPPGTLAPITQGEYLGIVQYQGQWEVIWLHDYDNTENDEDSILWFFVTPNKYRDPDWGSEQELDLLTETLNAWLAEPVFVPVAPAGRLERLVVALQEWIAAFEAEKDR